MFLSLIIQQMKIKMIINIFTFQISKIIKIAPLAGCGETSLVYIADENALWHSPYEAEFGNI